jgi:cysteine desulfuration protein SufE
MTTGTVNPRLAEIIEDFTALSGKERLELLLEFSDELPALPARYADHRDLLEPVPECQSPLFLAVELGGDNAVHLFFDAPPEAPTTRGFAGILHAGLDGLSADDVLATPGEFSSQLGLQDLVRIKRQVREQRG